MLKVSFKDASRLNWSGIANNMGYPGNDNVQLGCLMRIADASEKMASHFIALQNDRDYYKRQYEEKRDQNLKLFHSNAALRGDIKRLKNKK